ncbi:MAG: 1,4-alpha-glucan-branching enzyme, partial [Alistipes sp.]|nr:1,4-alpha-glucan-branching enzyme [Alistipes sp.]
MVKESVAELAMVAEDDWLKPVEAEVVRRHDMYLESLAAIEGGGSIVDYANGYRYYGWQYDEDMSGWWFREWLPAAYDVYIFGDFNNWQRTQLRLNKDTNGVWSIFFPDAMYAYSLTHGSLYKLHIHGQNGWHDRVPAYATRLVQDEITKNYSAQFWIPQPFDWGEDKLVVDKNNL